MRTNLYTKERRDSILNLLKENKRVNVNDLCQQFSVTGATIRTDLKALEEQGLLMRTHGGAIPMEYERTIEDTPKDREITKEKILIAQEAIKHINNDEVIAIDTGTTCYAFAQELIKSGLKGLSILTYDLKIALLISDNTEYRVQILGGQIRNNYTYVSGGSLLGEINRFSVDKAFIATNALDVRFGFSTPNYETAEIKHSLFEIAKTSIVLCDSPKMNKRCFCSFASIRDCDLLIIDKGLSDIDAKALQKENLPMMIV